MIHHHSTIDYLNPIAKHHLNESLVCWTLFLPNSKSTKNVKNLVKTKESATVTGTVTPSDFNTVRPGGWGSFHANGTDSYFSYPTSFGGMSATGTIAIWARWVGTNQDVGFITYGSIMGRTNTSTFNNHYLSLNGANPNTAKISWQPYAANVAGTNISTTSPGNDWVHIIVAFTSGSHRLFVNGIMESASTATGTFNSTVVPFSVGRILNTTLPSFAHAYLDDLRIYSKMLTDADAAQLYKESLTGYPTLLKRNAVRVFVSSAQSVSFNYESIFENLLNTSSSKIIDFSNKLTLSKDSILNEDNNLSLSKSNELDFENLLSISNSSILNDEYFLGYSENREINYDFLLQLSIDNTSDFDNILEFNNSTVIDFDNKLNINKNSIYDFEYLLNISLDSILDYDNILGLSSNNIITQENLLSLSSTNSILEEYLLNKIINNEFVFDYNLYVSKENTTVYSNLLSISNNNEIVFENTGESVTAVSADGIINFESLQNLNIGKDIIFTNILNVSKNTDINIDTLLFVSKNNTIPEVILTTLSKENIIPIAYGFSSSTPHFIYVLDSRNRLFELSSKNRTFTTDTKIREILTEEKDRIFSLTARSRVIVAGE